MSLFVIFDCPACERVEKLTRESDELWSCSGCGATLREHRDQNGATVDLTVVGG
ncbi:hypothetical protein [Haloferax larsenii]|uniref:Uncharacterized protein n=1 Tax=Haloferax larsenii TaxID=302484 RepID=A0A1H7KY98_HALLR|nr:hypothetical protein [Haloferax larsenii]UVE51423.1 hypothetical protein KU306_05970 [Haloferax larsenii]SEK90957.1 hypothetical protein SAMN04488691_102133 [Haloferax larsenii]